MDTDNMTFVNAQWPLLSKCNTPIKKYYALGERILVQCQAKENSVEYWMHEIWVDTCNQNKTVLIAFLLATSITASPTALNVVLELSHWRLGVQSGKNQNTGSKSSTSVSWRRENCNVMEALVGLLKDSVLSSF